MAPNKPKYLHYSYVRLVGTEAEAYDLCCPHCGADAVVLDDDMHLGTDMKGSLGRKAQCWICKREFAITENCWKYEWSKDFPERDLGWEPCP